MNKKLFLAFVLILSFAWGTVFAQTVGTAAPLVQTRWAGHSAPFTGMLPMDGGSRSAVGCEAVAVAQIMKFHNHPARGIGRSEPYTTPTRGIRVPSVNYDIAYDWSNMLNAYPDANTGTERQRNAVATLMLHVAVALKGDFRADGTGTGGTPRAMIDIFGYDKSMQAHQRNFHTDESWAAIIRAQIDAGLPVFYSGRNAADTFSHVFVADGYDSAGRIHFNMGYSGRLDGYYSLNDMPQNMNGFQSIRINIKPAERGVSTHEMALLDFSADKTSVTQNGQFTVTTRMYGVSYFPGGHSGAALVDNAGNITAIVGTRAAGERYPAGNTSLFEIECFVPNDVRPGQYKLMMVTRPTGGEWRIITLSDIRNGVPNACDITVNPYEGTAVGGGYGIALVEFPRPDNPIPQSIRQNELLTVVVRTRTVSAEAFPGGQLGAALVDTAGNIVEVIGAGNYGSLNPNANRNSTLNCYVPKTVTPGQYRLITVVKPEGGDWRLITNTIGGVTNAVNLTVTAETGVTPGGGYGMALRTFTSDKTTLSRNESFIVKFTLRNIGQEVFSGGQTGAAFIDNNGNIVEVVGIGNTGVRNPGGQTSLIERNCTVPNTVPRGQYQLRIVVRPTGGEWRIATLSYEGSPTSINFTVR